MLHLPFQFPQQLPKYPWMDKALITRVNAVVAFLFSFQEEGVEFYHNDETFEPSDNIMDRWILSFTQSLVKFVRQEMAGRQAEIHAWVSNNHFVIVVAVVIVIFQKVCGKEFIAQIQCRNQAI